MTFKRNIRLFCILNFILLNLIVFFTEKSFADDSEKKVYVIVANKLLLSDIDEMENLKSLVDEAGIGLMNVRGASSYNDIEGFLTINASSKSYGVQTMAQMYNLTEEKKSLYETRMGKLESDYEVGNVEFNRIKMFNEEKDHKPVIGALGDNLKKAQIKRAVYGNSDDEEHSRLGSLIAMDSKGLVEFGDVENINIEDDQAPYGKRIDYDKVLKNIQAQKEEVSFTVVDIGDLDRLSNYGMYLDDNMFDYHREKALNYLDEFVLKLKESVGSNSMIMILSPNEGEMRYEENKLSPVVIWESGKSSSLLTSGSTRVKGIITNMDIAPAISDYLNISKENYVGQSIEYVDDKTDRLSYLEKISIQNNFLLKARSVLLYYYAAFTIAALAILTIVASFASAIPKSYKKGLENLLSFTLALPIAFMATSLLNITSVLLVALSSVFISALLAFLIRNLSGKRKMLILLSSFLVIITGDTLTGSYLNRNSIMGYSPIMGARYFGIGNELSGLFLSSTGIVSGILIQKYNNKFFSLIPLLGLGIMVMPKLGANVGGSLSFAAMALCFLLLLSKKRVNFKTIVLLFLLLALSIVIIGVLDFKFSSNPTHLGRLIMDIKENGVESLITVVSRKISVNIRLMGSSIWSSVLVITTVLMGAIITIKKEKFQLLLAQNSFLGYSLISVVAGSIVGLLVNDSGVLLAAFANIYTTAFLIQFSIE